MRIVKCEGRIEVGGALERPSVKCFNRMDRYWKERVGREELNIRVVTAGTERKWRFLYCCHHVRDAPMTGGKEYDKWVGKQIGGL